MSESSAWQVVHRARWSHEAEIIKAKLQEADINCVIMDKQDSMYKQFDVFSTLEIYVKPNNVLRAKRIIQDLSFE